MTLDAIINTLRRIAGDVDASAYRYPKNDIVWHLSDAARELLLHKVASFGTYAVTTTLNAEAITPEPTDMDGLMLAYWGAIALLTRTYHKGVDEGSLGVTWRSGLEEESTISAEKAYHRAITRLEQKLAHLILIAGASTSATRPI